MEPLVFSREVRLRSPPAALWPLLSNSNRTNRALGLAEISTRALPGSFELAASAPLLWMTVSWRERPFDYVAGRFFTGVRVYDNGPIRRFEGGLRLEPDGGGTRAVVHGRFEPRGPLSRLLLRLGVPPEFERMAALLRRVDDALRRAAPLPLPRTLTPPDDALLAARTKVLAGSRADPAATGRLVEHLRSGYDDEVLDMRPFELADRWGLPRLAVLGACLHGVKAGLLDLRWELLCPNCAGAKQSLSSLTQLQGASHCAACGIEFGVTLDEVVELRVSAHPSVRPARDAVFCVGSPAHSKHAVAQLALTAGREREAELELSSASYLLRGLVSKRTLRLRPDAQGPAELAVDLDAAKGGAELSFKPGRVRLRLLCEQAELARVESEGWREAGATAARVTSLQEFRDLFSSEALAPGVELGVKRLALLFTDLKGSTALYEKIGDAIAYAVVRDHFAYLTGIVAQRRGAVVKTIGDAVMAVFASGADALEAALDMQERISELNARLAPRPPVVLKIGAHEGAAIAINAGGVLDYFGTTANVAARVQGESEGGDIVVTDVLRNDPAVAALLARRAPAQEPFKGALKGLSGVHKLWRLRCRPRPPA